MRDSTVEGLVFDGLREGCSGDLGLGLATSGLSCFKALGEISGDKEGNDSSVLAEFGETRDCFRERALTVPDLREAVDIWEEVRSRFMWFVEPAMCVCVCVLQ